MSKLLGDLIGKGMCAEVYNYGDGKVIKLFNKGTRIESIKKELEVNQIVNDLGVDSPKVYSIEHIDDRVGIIFDKVEGETLTSTLFDVDQNTKYCGELMAKLHLSLHNRKAPSMRNGMNWFKKRILKQELLSDSLKQELMEIANEIPNEETLCHSDFHFENIIYDNGKLSIIDWSGAYKGYALLDVARSYLILISPYIPYHLNKPAKEMKQIQRVLSESYLNYYLKYSIFNKEQFIKVLRVIAVERIDGNVPHERDWLLGIIGDNRLPTVL